jgi:hypothetical protein
MCISPPVRGFSCILSPVHVTIYCSLWPPGNTTCLFLTWYQSDRFAPLLAAAAARPGFLPPRPAAAAASPSPPASSGRRPGHSGHLPPLGPRSRLGRHSAPLRPGTRPRSSLQPRSRPWIAEAPSPPAGDRPALCCPIPARGPPSRRPEAPSPLLDRRGRLDLRTGNWSSRSSRGPALICSSTSSSIA